MPELTLTPLQVIRRDPIQATHQPLPSEMVTLLDELAAIAGGGGVFSSLATMLAASIPAAQYKISCIHDGMIVNFVRDATGTAATTADGATWSPADIAWPQHWGAIGDNSTDCSDAFEGMFDWCIGGAGNWREMHIPAGEYVITRQYENTTDTNNDSASFGMTLTGTRASTIVNQNPDGFFKWVQSSARDIGVKMENFNIRMENTGTNGIPIWLEQATGGLSRNQDIIIDGVMIYPSSNVGIYPAIGIRTKGFYFSAIRNCYIAGPYSGSQSKAVQHQGFAGIDVSGCFGIEVESTKSWSGWHGFYQEEKLSSGGEGGSLTRCVFDSEVGVFLRTGGGEPGFAILDTHINADTYGFWAQKRKLIDVKGNIWYNTTQPYTNKLTWSDDLTQWSGSATKTARRSPTGDEVYVPRYEAGVFVEDTNAVGNSGVSLSVTSMVQNDDYVLSAVMKQGSVTSPGSQSMLNFTSGAFDAQVRITWGATPFDVPTVTASGDALSAGVIDLADGRWLFYVTANWTPVSTTATAIIYPALFGTAGVSGVGSVEVFSVQLEEGTFPRYHLETTGATQELEYTDVKLEDVQYYTQTATRFWFGGNSRRVNVDIDADCEHIQMHDCSHEADGKAYRIAAGADDVFIENPRYASTITAEVTDAGGTNVVVKPRQSRYVQWGLAAVQSVANSTQTDVVWSESHGALGFGNTPGSTITIPSNKGISKVRITFQSVWANNSTGVRQLRVTKNGSYVDGCGKVSVDANGLSENQIVSVLNVTGGDVIRAQVYQDSGGALNLGAAGAWIRVEEI